MKEDTQKECDRAVIPRFPALFGDGERVPGDLVGSKIIAIGVTNNQQESGEFMIQYLPANGSFIKRLLVLFNERGMWLDSESIVNDVSD